MREARGQARPARRVRTRGLLVVALLLGAAAAGGACGGGGTEPTPPEQGTPRLRKVSGDSQRTPVTENTGQMIAQVYRDTSGTSAGVVRVRLVGAGTLADTQVVSGVPMPGQLVNFVPDDPAKGRPWAGATITDSLGYARDYVETGTTAGHLHIYVRAVDQQTGERLVYDSFYVLVKPGPATGFSLSTGYLYLHAGDTIDLHTIVTEVHDAYGNYLVDRFHDRAVDSSYVPRWTWWPANVTDGTYAPTDSGWTAVVPAGSGEHKLWFFAGPNDSYWNGITVVTP